MFLVLSRTPPPVALLGFLNIREKEKGLNPPFHGPTCDASFSVHMNSFVNPNSEGVQNYITNHISKFHNNPTINEFGIIILP